MRITTGLLAFCASAAYGMAPLVPEDHATFLELKPSSESIPALERLEKGLQHLEEDLEISSSAPVLSADAEKWGCEDHNDCVTCARNSWCHWYVGKDYKAGQCTTQNMVSSYDKEYTEPEKCPNGLDKFGNLNADDIWNCGKHCQKNVKRYKDFGVEQGDTIFVFEGGGMVKDLSHWVIQFTSSGHTGTRHADREVQAVYTHALIVTEVTDEEVWVMEAVSNVGAGEAKGTREVSLKQAFTHVERFTVLRKQGSCMDEQGEPVNKMPDAIDWARRHAKGASYPSFASFTSVISTFEMGHPMGYNNENTPDNFYCSHLVAWILYKAQCAFHSGSNLNIDPTQQMFLMTWAYQYKTVFSSDKEAEGDAKKWLGGDANEQDKCHNGMQTTRAEDCESIEPAPGKRGCKLVGEKAGKMCSWVPGSKTKKEEAKADSGYFL